MSPTATLSQRNIKRPIVYSDFEDRTGSISEIEVHGIPIGTDMEAFRRKARAFLRPHENHISIVKLRRNEPLTSADLAELERMFVEAGVRAEAMDRLKEEGGLGRFVRSLVGLDREAAQAAFTEFLRGRSLTGSQHEFLSFLTRVVGLGIHPFGLYRVRAPANEHGVRFAELGTDDRAEARTSRDFVVEPNVDTQI